MVDLSIITPAWNEEKNLPLMHEELVEALKDCSMVKTWEWIVVDDHSSDETPRVLSQLSQKDSRVKGIRFKTNLGSHRAIYAGLKVSSGENAVILSSDLQDPPKLIGKLLSTKMENQNDVVWAAREKTNQESESFFAKLYFYLIYRNYQLRKQLRSGSDYLILDRAIVNGLIARRRIGFDLFCEISRLSQNPSVFHYSKRKRIHGESGWNLKKKIIFVLKALLMIKILPDFEVTENWGEGLRL